MSRRSKEEMQYIFNLIKKIKEENPSIGPMEIGKILHDKYNKNLSKQTLLDSCNMIQIRQNTPTSNIELEYEDNPEIIKINERIAALEIDFKNAESATDRNKYNSALNDTQKSKLEMKKILREAEMLKKNSDKAQYIVKFGEPTVINSDNRKKPFFKADDKQKTIPIEEGDKQ
jgi:Zn-dependent oligopeptidase